MKNIAKILMVLALAFVSFGVNAQAPVKKGSVHRFTMGTTKVNSSMYVWKVLNSSGTDALDTEYKFVKGYNDLSNPATTDNYEVFIQFTGAVNDVFTVQVQEKDATTFCSDDTYNVKTTDVIIAENDFWGKLSWNLAGSAAADSDCAIRDDGDKTTVNFTLTVNDDATTKNWNYTYAIGVSDNSDAEADVIWDADQVAAPVDGTKTTDAITTKKVATTGEGYYYVWVKIVKLTDGFGMAYNEGHDETVAITKAKLRKIPAAQTVQMAD